jgi:hypothetical protein
MKLKLFLSLSGFIILIACGEAKEKADSPKVPVDSNCIKLVDSLNNKIQQLHDSITNQQDSILKLNGGVKADSNDF